MHHRGFLLGNSPLHLVARGAEAAHKDSGWKQCQTGCAILLCLEARHMWTHTRPGYTGVLEPFLSYLEAILTRQVEYCAQSLLPWQGRCFKCWLCTLSQCSYESLSSVLEPPHSSLPKTSMLQRHSKKIKAQSSLAAPLFQKAEWLVSISLFTRGQHCLKNQFLCPHRHRKKWVRISADREKIRKKYPICCFKKIKICSVYCNAKEVSQPGTEISDYRTGMKEKKFVQSKVLMQWGI